MCRRCLAAARVGMPAHRPAQQHWHRTSEEEPRLAHQPSASGLQLFASWLQRVAGAAVLVQSFTGPCVVNGDCVCSSNFQAARCAATSDASRRYGNGEACNVTFSQPVALHVHLFNTEKKSDILFADGTRFSGTQGPNGVVRVAWLVAAVAPTTTASEARPLAQG